MIRFIAAIVLAFSALSANASQTWIVFGNSILSNVPQGVASQSALHLLAAEKDIFFKNLSSTAAALGAADKTGFNLPYASTAINQIGGMYTWYNGVLIQEGTNDFGRGVSVNNTIDSLRRILNKVRADGKKALVLGAIYRDGEDVPNGLNDSLCAGAGGNTLNCYRYFMAVVCDQEYGDVCHYASQANTVMGSLNNNYDSTEVANNMRLHPNAAGHRKLADWIKAEAAAAGYF